jgi:hypothetical protein
MSVRTKWWLRQSLTVIGLTIMIMFACLSIDSAYLSNPIGHSSVGIKLSDGIPLPASSEITVTADGIDPIRIDLKSADNDFSGMVSVTDPSGRVSLQKKYGLRYYPPSIFPNPSKWITFMAPNRGAGTYRVYVSQEEYGTAEFYAYQGPFWARIFFLPLFSILVLIIVNVTFSKRKIRVAAKDTRAFIGKKEAAHQQAETVLECKIDTTMVDAEIIEETICEPVTKD